MNPDRRASRRCCKGGSGSGGAGSASNSPRAGISGDSVLGSMPLSRIEAEVVPRVSLAGDIADGILNTDTAARNLTSMLTPFMSQLKGFDPQGNFASALDRMGWSDRYNNPTDNMMADRSGSGFLITVTDLRRIQRGAYQRVPPDLHGVLKQTEEVMKYQVKAMWNNATPKQRAIALKAYANRVKDLGTVGLKFD